MTFHPMRPLAAVATLAGATAVSGAQLPPISALTPQRALFVVEIDDFQALRDGAEESGVLEVLTSEKTRRFVQSYIASQSGEEDFEPLEFDDVLDRLGLDRDDLAWPTGRVGLSGYLPWQPDDLAELFAQGEEPSNPVVLFSADFGEHAAQMRDTLERIVDYGLGRDMLEIDSEQQIDGNEVVVLLSLERRRRDEAMEAFDEEYSRRAEAAARNEQWDGLWEWYGENVPEFTDPEDPVSSAIADLFASVDTVAYAWIGDALILGTAFDPLADAVEAGEAGVRDAAAGAGWYLNAFADLDRQPHARAALNANLFVRTFVEGFVWGMQSVSADFDDEFDSTEASQSTRNVLRSLGLDALDGMGLTLRLAPRDAVAEMGLHLHLTEKRGLFDLFAEPQPLQPPSFLTGEAIGISRILIDFPRLTDVAQSVVAAMPAEQRQMAQAQLQQARVIADPILRELGPEFFMWEYPADPQDGPRMGPMGMPIDFGAKDVMLAISLRDARPLSDTLTGFGQHLQLAPRDFAGGQLFESQFIPMTLGVGNGWLLLGRTQRVEDAMRLAADQGARAQLDELDRALEGVDTRAAFVSWGSTRREIDAMYDRFEALPAEAPEHEWWRPTREPWMDELPERQWLLQRLGDVVSVLRSTDSGITGFYRMLEPRE